MARNLVLIGFMGVGKTTVGRLAAVDLGFPFADLDEMIAERAGRPIPAIFEDQGEDAFRLLETGILREAQAHSDTVLAVGGGAPCRGVNQPLLRSLGCLAHLVASPETILRRVQPLETRPMLAGSADPLERIRELLAIRMPYYEMADLTIRTEDRDPAESARELARTYRAWLEANP